MKTVYILVPRMFPPPETDTLLLVQVQLNRYWMNHRTSRVGGGITKPMFEGMDYGMFVIDGERWTGDEVREFAATRFLVIRALELGDEVANELFTYISSRAQSGAST